MLAVGALFTLGFWEWSNFVAKNIIFKLIFLFFGALLLLVLSLVKVDVNEYIMSGSLVWVLLTILLLLNSQKIHNWFGIVNAVIGFGVFSIAFVSMSFLRSEFGPSMLMYLLVLVWTVDIGAYFAGKNFGKHKLIPVISPNKTVEGLVGGLSFSVVCAIFGAYFLGFHGSKVILFCLVTIATAIFSVVGDLFESLLKRQAGIKDSGSIFPGHGGVLDRVDSLLSALPVFVFCLGIIN